MNIKSTIISFLLLCAPAFAIAQTAKNTNKAHQRAHSVQLAKQQKLDKATISSIMKNELAARENTSTLSPRSAKMVDDLLAEANRYIGRPYRHGAKGPKAFDCSGFTSYVYKQFGFNISPASRAQFLVGTKVEKGDLRKGDLVFFTSRSSGKNVGHVGIVVSADNEKGSFKFIHASIRGVKISDFSGYYVPRYLGARRLIDR